jgi:hypothetical protein
MEQYRSPIASSMEFDAQVAQAHLVLRRAERIAPDAETRNRVESIAADIQEVVASKKGAR